MKQKVSGLRSPFFTVCEVWNCFAEAQWLAQRNVDLFECCQFVDSKVRELDLVGTRLNFELVPLVAIFGELT